MIPRTDPVARPTAFNLALVPSSVNVSDVFTSAPNVEVLPTGSSNDFVNVNGLKPRRMPTPVAPFPTPGPVATALAVLLALALSLAVVLAEAFSAFTAAACSCSRTFGEVRSDCARALPFTSGSLTLASSVSFSLPKSSSLITTVSAGPAQRIAPSVEHFLLGIDRSQEFLGFDLLAVFQRQHGGGRRRLAGLGIFSWDRSI